MYGTRISGAMAKNSKHFTISINHYICPIFHAENNLSKLQFNLAHFIGLILTLRGPTCTSLALEKDRFSGNF
jgi:hypothetical protein